MQKVLAMQRDLAQLENKYFSWNGMHGSIHLLEQGAFAGSITGNKKLYPKHHLLSHQ